MSITRPKALDLEIFAHDSIRGMSSGERAALEGVLAQLAPSLSLEIGATGSEGLKQTAAHSREVHSFGLVVSEQSATNAENITVHAGDPHTLLPDKLRRLAEAKRNVDFVLFDGEHSSEGVRQNIEDLLNSPALGSSIILIHGTTNEAIRGGLDAVHYSAWPKVGHVDLDFVPGYLFREGNLRHELWGGLGLVIVDSTRLAYTAGPIVQDHYYPAASLFADARDRVVERASVDESDGSGELEENDVSQEDRLLEHIGELESEILRITSVSIHHEKLWREMMESISWRITTPLRWLVGLARKFTNK